MKPERKKALKKAFKAREIEVAREKLCLSPEQLGDLRAYLEASLGQLNLPCDHSLARTSTWAQREGLEIERMRASVREFGGFCDCEVLFNVTPDKFGWD